MGRSVVHCETFLSFHIVILTLFVQFNFSLPSTFDCVVYIGPVMLRYVGFTISFPVIVRKSVSRFSLILQGAVLSVQS